MATIVLKNVSASEKYLRELGVRIGPSGQTDSKIGPTDTITVVRPAADVQKWLGIAAQVAAGDITISITPSADEIAAGILTPDQAIQAKDVALPDALGFGVPFVIRKAIVAGVAAAADDVVVVAANTLPYKLRIIDAWANISAGNAGGRTMKVYDQAAAAGTKHADFDAASAARVQSSAPVATAAVTPGATAGLFVHRSHDAIAGEVFLLVVREP